MAEAAFSLAVENLQILLIQQPNIPSRLREKAHRLKDELQIVQSLLRDAATLQRSSIYQLLEVAQDAEDVLQASDATPNYRPSRPLQAFFACSSSSGRHVQGPAREIKSIHARLKAIIRMRKLVPNNGEFSSVRRQLVPTTSVLNDRHVVGMEQDVNRLLSRAILNERTGLFAVALVGPGGIGKTTLAGVVYNNHAVAQHFERRAWIFVSSRFSLEDVIRLVVRRILQSDEMLDAMERSALPDLQLMLHQVLSRRRYLVVLDDVWEYADMEALLAIFPNEGIGSRLLITSRNRDITRQAHWVHEMALLDSYNSWQLLLIATSITSCPEHLLHIGREILANCHGLPSAIKEAGRLLRDRQSARQWENVLKTLDVRVLSNALELSYERLSPELKLCFLCLAIFRQGTTIRAEKLVQVWVAAGMVHQDEQMEETAASLLDGLIAQHMVKIEDKRKDDRVKNCRVCEVFLKPSIRKAEDEISLEILREEGSSRPIQKPRHRAIYCTRAGFIYSANQNKFLRSLFFHGGGSLDLDPSYWKSFRLLLVLDFEGFGLEEFPEVISSLNGLKYLGLRNNFIKVLPESLGCLENLKVLDISLNFAVLVPDVIWKMECLRHVYMSDIVCQGGLKIDRLVNLQTLAYIPANKWSYERSSLQTMTSLRKVGIEELDQGSSISDLLLSLAHLRSLVCLNLRGFRFKEMPSLNEVGYLENLTQLKIDGLLGELPDASDFPPNLCYLTLFNTSLEQDPMPVLEKLSKLLYIRLREAYTGDRMVISQEGFPRLQVMRMGDLRHLKNVQVEAGAMPVLRRWEINGCTNLEKPPSRATIID